MKLSKATVAGATAIVVMSLAAAACIAPAPTTSAPGGQAPAPAPGPGNQTGGTFLETFTGAPGTPTPWTSPNWDVSVHSRDQLGNTVDTMEAQHGADCGAPPATHSVSSFEGSVFQCKDHMMTAIKGDGYGVIYLTPNHLVDFSKGQAVVSLDVSTFIASRRDWWDLWITPYEDNLQLPGEDWYPDLQGPPRRAVHIRMDTFNGNQSGFTAEIFNNFKNTVVPGDLSAAYEQVLVPDAARRDTFELRITQNHLQFGMPAYGMWWINTAIPDLGWNRGVVQIGHHSYNPTKDDVVPGAHAGTWHWDNVKISPASPFSIIHADRRAVSDSSPVSFQAPAPAGGRLRFEAWGSGIQVSFDGGASWSAAQPQAIGQAIIQDHFVSYWTPMPAGATQVRLRGGPDWTARDITIWG